MTRTARATATPAPSAGVVVVALGHNLLAGDAVRARHRRWVHLVGTSHVTQAQRTTVDVLNTKGHFGAVYPEEITEVGLPHLTGKRQQCWCLNLEGTQP